MIVVIAIVLERALTVLLNMHNYLQRGIGEYCCLYPASSWFLSC